MPKRTYQMSARAEAAEETRRRIIAATLALYTERWIDQIALEDVAARAGVTVQTVIRRFGNKDGLITATGQELGRHVTEQRYEAPIGDVAGAIRNLFDHYEVVGDIALRSLAQEGRYPALLELTDYGRQIHQGWVERTFAPQIAAAEGHLAERLRAQLVAVTDVYVWKLLRRDLALNRDRAEAAVRGLVEALQHEPARGDRGGVLDGAG